MFRTLGKLFYNQFLRKPRILTEECPICMELTDFDNVTAKYWLCCGKRMCEECNSKDAIRNKALLQSGNRRKCPFL